MQFNALDHRVYNAMLGVDRETGLSAWQITQLCRWASAFSVWMSLERLLKAGYIESKWDGGGWNQSHEEAFGPRLTNNSSPRRRYYRTTTEARQTLDALLKSAQGL